MRAARLTRVSLFGLFSPITVGALNDCILSTQDKINLLGRAEYRYDRLVSDFSEHYLEIMRSGYQPAPDLEILHSWLRHLNFEIRPSLLESWKSAAHLAKSSSWGI
jgi:hypothetical protein